MTTHHDTPDLEPETERVYPSPVSEQAQLEEPVIIPLRLNPRKDSQYRPDLKNRIMETASEADSRRPFRGCSVRTFERRRSALEIRSFEEAEDLLKHVHTFTTGGGLEPWMKPTHLQMFVRLKDAVRDELQARDIAVRFYDTGDVDVRREEHIQLQNQHPDTPQTTP